MDYENAAELLKIMGHPTRLRILMHLRNENKCVKNIWESLSLPQANVSQHLILMKNKGILDSERNGSQICYFLNNGNVTNILNYLDTTDNDKNP
jgi:DNA-binding transcriptional ArsR family regulator